MKTLALLLILAAAGVAQKAEAPNCYNNRISINGTVSNTIRMNANDVANPATQYLVNAYIDDPTMTSPTDFVSVMTIGGTALFEPSGTIGAFWGRSGKNPQDGRQHTFYFNMVSRTHGNVSCVAGSGWPYKWNLLHGVADYTYQPITNFTSGANPLTLAVIANTSDTYSVGSIGNTVCTVNGTALKDDGIAGYYIQKYGIPCGHAHVWTVATIHAISSAAATTAYAALTPPLSSSEQFIALAWVLPDQINGIISADLAGTLTNTTVSMPGFFLSNGKAIPWHTIFTTNALRVGDSTVANPYFESTTATPQTTYGIRPTFMLAGETCTISPTKCTTTGNIGNWTASFAQEKATIDAAFAARETNPTSGQIYVENNSGDYLRSAQYSLTSLLAYGTNTGVAPSAANVTISSPPFSTTISLTNILSFVFPSVNPALASNPAFIGRGVGYMTAQTSGSGNFSSVDQAPIALYLNYGAAFSCGSNEEPVGMISTKYPEEMLMMSTYTRGDSAIEAAYRATKQPNSMLCSGDPLARPFKAPGGGG